MRKQTLVDFLSGLQQALMELSATMTLDTLLLGNLTFRSFVRLLANILLPKEGT